MLNHIVIMGRLTRDPETRNISNSTTQTQFTVACDRDYVNANTGERKTDFHICRAWQQTGEFVEKYFQKGSMIVVTGRMQTDTWDDIEGNKHSITYISVEKVYFGEKKKDSARTEPYTAYDRSTYNKEPRSDFRELPDDGDIPF